MDNGRGLFICFTINEMIDFVIRLWYYRNIMCYYRNIIRMLKMSWGVLGLEPYLVVLDIEEKKHFLKKENAHLFIIYSE